MIGGLESKACVVEFGGGLRVTAGWLAARDEYLAAGQQHRAVKIAGVNEISRRAPGVGDWIVEFGAVDGAAAGTTPGDEHFSIG